MKNCTLKIFSCLILLVLSMAGNADQFDPRLDDLFQSLQSTKDPRQALQLETTIWQAWLSHDNLQASNLMSQGIQQMNRGSMYEALDTFDRLIELQPEYSEAWNKRATIYYYLGNYKESAADISKTLALEPFHFGALSGQGLVYLAQQEYLLARNAFNAALEVNPTMRDVKSRLSALEEFLRSAPLL